MFQKRLKQIGAWSLAFTLAAGAVQLPAAPVRAADITGEMQSVLDSLSAPEVSVSDIAIYMPNTPFGVNVRFCADYEQVVGEDGTIYTPLEDKQIKGFYEVTQDEASAKTSEFTFTVPGLYSDEPGVNEKPAVIPELQEWHGKKGTFIASANSRIVVGDNELMEVADKFAKDYKDITGLDISVISGTSSAARVGDFFMALVGEESGLDKEGYTIDIDNAAVIEAEQPTGAYWATRTILQILKQTSGSIPKGLVRDYPKYEVRGFSFDIGRKPFSLDTVYQFAENMSWYKMNSFQLHLSDNLIFHEDYATLEEAAEQSYAGFRLESDVIGEETNKSATSEDMYYTKDEFRTFIQDCRLMGVDVVPEFDMPAHALPFTRAFPEYMSYKAGGSHKYLIEELNLEKEGVTEWAQSIWNDYFEGPDPVFDEGMTVHIGTDEYHGTDGQAGKELFRQFSDDMIKFVQSKGRNVRMWGSLTNKSGTTPVASEGVQLNIWNTGYANPLDMYNLGYDLINTLEGPNYIVPAAGYYNNYINTNSIYTSWQPNVMGNLTASAGDDQILGGCYAIWHDSIDTRANGISEYDSFDRFFKAVPAYGAKLWGDAKDRDYNDFVQLAAKTGTAPNTNMYAEVDYSTNQIAEYTFTGDMMKDSSVNGYHLTSSENVSLLGVGSSQSLCLQGGKSYVETPLDMIGDGAVLTMEVKMDADAQGEQILCESKDTFGTYGTYAIKASQKETGKVGFSREGYNFSFDYTLPSNDWVELSFHSGQDSVALYVDGELVDDDPEIYFETHPTTELTATLKAKGIIKTSTMLIPLGRIGSTTNSFKGEIAYVSVTGQKEASAAAPGVIPHSEMTAAACSEAPTTASEGPANYAIDDNESTYWHTNWSSDVTISEEAPHWFEVTLANPKTINKLTYLPRQDATNGRIFSYSIEVTKPDGTTQLVVDKGTWANDSSRKTAEFAPIEAKKVKILIYDAQGDNVGVHATIAELNLYEPAEFGVNELKQEIAKYEGYEKGNYTDISWNIFAGARLAAQQICDYTDSTQDDYLYAWEQLVNAVANLTEKTAPYRLLDAVLEAEAQLANANTYTEDSVRELQQAVNASWTVLRKQDATDAEAENAIANLNGIKLVEKPQDVPTPTPTPTPTPDDNKTPGTDIPTPTPAVPKVGTTISAGGVTYKVTKSDAVNGTVAASKLKNTKNAKITIPSTVTIEGIKFKVTKISSKAFQNAKKLNSVVIGANVTSIESKAFYNCKKLKNITFKSVKAPKVGSNAFKGIVAKSTVTVPKKITKKQLNSLKTSLKKAGVNKKASYKKK